MSEQKLTHLQAFGIHLRELRKARGWALREVEARSGIAYTNIGEIERGERDPSYSTLQKLAETYGEDLIIKHV